MTKAWRGIGKGGIGMTERKNRGRAIIFIPIILLMLAVIALDMGIFADGSDKPVGRCGDYPDSGDEDSQSAARQVTEWCGAR